MGKGSSKLQSNADPQQKSNNKNSNINQNKGKNNESNNSNNFTYDGIKYDYIDICILLKELRDAVIINIDAYDAYNKCKNKPEECKSKPDERKNKPEECKNKPDEFTNSNENIISEIIGIVYDITELISNMCTYIVAAKVYNFDGKVVNCIAYHFWFVFSLVILHDNSMILTDNFFKSKNKSHNKERKSINGILYVDYHTLKYKITDTFTCFIYMHNNLNKSVKDIFNKNKDIILKFWADKLSEKKNKNNIQQTIFDKYNTNSNNRWSNSSKA
jgi:hypothetical protein